MLELEMAKLQEFFLILGIGSWIMKCQSEEILYGLPFGL